MRRDVVVRGAVPADAPAIVRLLLGGSRDPGAEDPTAPERYAAAIGRIRAAGGEVLVAELGGAVVGVCEVCLLEHLQHAGGRVAELESVHVSAPYRSLGVGHRMVAEATAWAAERGCYRVQLTSHASRVDAHRFYERCGFEATHVGFKRTLGAHPADPGG